MKTFYFMCFVLSVIYVRAQFTNVWYQISSSANVYGSSLYYSKPLQWNDELNLISFVHLKPPTYTLASNGSVDTENGSVLANISSDCGMTWDSTAVYSNTSFFARFPQGGICTPSFSPCRYELKNAFIVACGPTAGSGTVGYNGNWYASKKLGQANYNNIPGSGNQQQVFPKTGPFPTQMGKHDFSAHHFTATDDGLMRSLALVSDDNQLSPSDTGIALITGSMDTSGVMNWSDTVFRIHCTKTSLGKYNFESHPMMAWNESGTNGYLVFLGARKWAAGSNKGIQPIVYKTANGGHSWTLDSVGIDFNSQTFSGIKSTLFGTSLDSSLKVPAFNYREGLDCAVDANNKLHIFTTLRDYRSIHPDSLSSYREIGPERYTWAHIPGRRPYLYDFIFDGFSWTYRLIDSMSTEGPGAKVNDPGFADNPWDSESDSPFTKIELSARLQLSRTPDGKYLVYTWSETDTTLVTNYRKWNIYPNIRARVLSVTNNLLYSNKINITIPSNGQTAPNSVKNRCMFYFSSPKCCFITSNSNGPFIRIPLLVSNNSPYNKSGKVNHWFSLANLNIGNVSLNPFTPPFICPGPGTCLGLDEQTGKGGVNMKLLPNPAVGNCVLGIHLVKQREVTITLINSLGEIAKSKRYMAGAGDNELTIDLTGLASGIYMVNVKVDDASSTKKLIVE